MMFGIKIRNRLSFFEKKIRVWLSESAKIASKECLHTIKIAEINLV